LETPAGLAASGACDSTHRLDEGELMAAHWWIEGLGMGLMMFGLFVSLKNGALGGPSLYAEMRAGRGRGQVIFAIGTVVLLTGHLFRLKG
jgi:hypothetical protein